MTNSASIITMFKNEHDFINQWLEYHLKIGFSHFYILVDNIHVEQPEYNIEDTFKSNVTFINITKDTLKKHNFIDNLHHSVYLHTSLTCEKIHKEIIKEECVAAIGLDQFIYLKDINITTFLESIDKECTQIIIPWSICSNNSKDLPYDNLMANVSQYSYEYNTSSGHSNGFIRTNNVRHLFGDSHSFVSKSSKQQIHICDEYFTKDDTLDTWEIFGIVHQKMNKIAFYDLKISSFHFFLRNLDEVIVKTYCSWNYNTSLHVLVECIKNNSVELELINQLSRMKYVKKQQTEYNLTNLNIPNITSNAGNYCNDLIVNMLKEYNITKEQYCEWKNNILINEIDNY